MNIKVQLIQSAIEDIETAESENNEYGIVLAMRSIARLLAAIAIILDGGDES